MSIIRYTWMTCFMTCPWYINSSVTIGSTAYGFRQEVFLAAQDYTTINCGSVSIPWTLFCCAWLAIRRGRFQKEVPEVFEQLEEWASRRQTLDGFMSQYPNAYLDRLWQDSGGSKCADPRDRIYVVRGLLYADIADAIEPDYTKPVVDVFRDAMLAHSDAFNSLDILGQCQYSPLWDGPSWVQIGLQRSSAARHWRFAWLREC
jgi:hypothetical protein